MFIKLNFIITCLKLNVNYDFKHLHHKRVNVFLSTCMWHWPAGGVEARERLQQNSCCPWIRARAALLNTHTHAHAHTHTHTHTHMHTHTHTHTHTHADHMTTVQNHRLLKHGRSIRDVGFWRGFLKLKVGEAGRCYLRSVSLPDNRKWAKKAGCGWSWLLKPRPPARQQWWRHSPVTQVATPLIMQNIKA